MPPFADRVVSSDRGHTTPRARAPAHAAPRSRQRRHPADGRHRERGRAAASARRAAARRDPGRRHRRDPRAAVAAVDEAARLLEADGAMVYLHRPGDRTPSLRARRRHPQPAQPGVGPLDPTCRSGSGCSGGPSRSAPSSLTRRLPRRRGRSSTRRTPTGSSRTSGSGRWSSRRSSPATRSSGRSARSRRAPMHSAPAQIGLVRALADHAAAAMANARLIEALDASRGELAKRAEIERSLREIGARISAAARPAGRAPAEPSTRPPACCDAEGARIDLIDPASGLLRGAYASGALRARRGRLAARPRRDARPGGRRAGRRPRAAVLDGRLPPRRALPARLRGVDPYVRGDRHPVGHGRPARPTSGAIRRPDGLRAPTDAWGETDAGLLATIADQASITIRTTRLIAELDRSREALARRAEAEQALREIAARITGPARAGRDPGRRRQACRPTRRAPTGSSSTCSIRRPGTCTGPYDDGCRSDVHGGGTGRPVDLGRRRGDRARRSPRIASSSPTTTSRRSSRRRPSRPSSTSGPASIR